MSEKRFVSLRRFNKTISYVTTIVKWMELCSAALTNRKPSRICNRSFAHYHILKRMDGLLNSGIERFGMHYNFMELINAMSSQNDDELSTELLFISHFTSIQLSSSLNYCRYFLHSHFCCPLLFTWSFWFIYYLYYYYLQLCHASLLLGCI